MQTVLIYELMIHSLMNKFFDNICIDAMGAKNTL